MTDLTFGILAVVGSAVVAWTFDWSERSFIDYREPNHIDLRRIKSGYALFSLRYRRLLRGVSILAMWLSFSGAAALSRWPIKAIVPLIILLLMIGVAAMVSSMWWFIYSKHSKWPR